MISFSLSQSVVPQFVDVACELPCDVSHLPVTMQKLMRLSSTLDLLSEQRQALVVVVMHVAVIRNIEQRLQNPMVEMLNNLVRVYYGLSKHPHIFSLTSDLPLTPPTTEACEVARPLREQIEKEAGFQPDEGLLCEMIACVQQWPLTLIVLPMILREVMKLAGAYGASMSSLQKERLVVAVLTVMILSAVENEALRLGMTQALHGLVNVYYALSRGRHIFSPQGRLGSHGCCVVM